jgi:hypothetical protein
MNIRQILATSVAVLALASTPALHASITSVALPVHATYTKGKLIKISFRNDSGSVLELKAGDNVMKVASGATLSLKLPEGTKVLTNNATQKLTAGELITEVATYLDGATLSIH